MSSRITVEVAFATPESQSLVEVRLPAGATVAAAIAASGLIDAFPQYALNALPVGIWGRVTEAGKTLQGGERVEIYRELLMDPMESRRLKASNSGPVPFESR